MLVEFVVINSSISLFFIKLNPSSVNRQCDTAAFTDFAPFFFNNFEASTSVFPVTVMSSTRRIFLPLISPTIFSASTSLPLRLSLATIASLLPRTLAYAIAILALPKSGEHIVKFFVSCPLMCLMNRVDACKWSTGMSKNPTNC